MADPKLIAERFLKLLSEQNQLQMLPEIIEVLQEQAWRNLDIQVVSSQSLSETEQKQLKGVLIDRFGEHRVIFAHDPVLLSGLLVKFGDQVIDLSGRKGLKDLNQALSS